jgi:hypothetical protein
MWRPFLLLTALLCGARLASAQATAAPQLTPTAGDAFSPPPAQTARMTPSVPAAAPVPEDSPVLGPETLQSFDYSLAELQWSDRRWRLVAAGVLLKDFGRHETEAREALRLVRDLRLSQRGTVGTPRPVMEYWLADGRAPQGLLQGLHALPLDPASLRVEQVQGQWWVRDNNRTLFNFGSHVDEARQALAVLRHYDFTQVAAVGRPAPDMLVFLGDVNGLAPARSLSAFSRRTFPPAHETGPAVQQTAFTAPAPDGAQAPRRPLGAAPGAPAAPGLPAGASAAPSLADQLADAERVTLDWQQAQVRQDDDGWKLIVGNLTLANFGPHDSDARLALQAVQFYRFTEHGALGRPRPLFSYFLTNGQAPHGYMFGLQHDPFHPATLTVRQSSDAWWLVDGARPVLNFGDHPDEARQALRLIQRYQFDTLCRIGHPDTGAMTFFVRAR